MPAIARDRGAPRPGGRRGRLPRPRHQLPRRATSRARRSATAATAAMAVLLVPSGEDHRHGRGRRRSPPTTAPCAERLARLRTHGMTRDPAAFQHARPGLRRRRHAESLVLRDGRSPASTTAPPTSTARSGSSQLRSSTASPSGGAASLARYDGCWRRSRRRCGRSPRARRTQPAWHLYAVLIDFAGARHHRGAGDGGADGARHRHPGPLHSRCNRQPYYRRRYGESRCPAPTPTTRAASPAAVSAMTDADVDRVVDALAAALGNR